MAADSAPAPASGGLLRSRLGPLPVWGWLLVMTGIAVGYWYFFARSKQSGAAGQDQGGTAQVPEVVVSEAGMTAGQGETEPPEAPEPKEPRPHQHHRHRRPRMIGHPLPGGGSGPPPQPPGAWRPPHPVPIQKR